MQKTSSVSPEGNFVNEDGLEIYCRYWNRDPALSKDLPERLRQGHPRGLIFICHGYGEHCLWYNEVAEMLVRQGFFVFAHDHMGMGQSGGTRGDVQNFEQYTRDVFQHIEKVQSEMDQNLPVFIIGHSMGGAVTILSALERPKFFAGMVLIGPAVVPNPDALGPCRIFFGKIAAHLIPQLVVLKLDPSSVSRDQEIVQKYKDDPLVIHFGIKARWGLSFLHAVQKIEKECSNMDTPFLVLHGDQDQLCHVSGSKILSEQAKATDKEIKIYKDHYHQLHNELPDDRVKVHKDISDWLLKRSEGQI